MARKRISIDVKIERQKDIVSKAKDKYEAELSVLEELMQKRRDMRSKKLMKAIENSDRSYEEIMAFLGEKNTLESDRQGCRELIMQEVYMELLQEVNAMKERFTQGFLMLLYDMIVAVLFIWQCFLRSCC